MRARSGYGWRLGDGLIPRGSVGFLWSGALRRPVEMLAPVAPLVVILSGAPCPRSTSEIVLELAAIAILSSSSGVNSRVAT